MQYATLQRIPFFWDMTQRQTVIGFRRFGQSIFLIFKGGCVLGIENNMLPRNVGFQLPTQAASYPIRTEASATPLRKSQDSQFTLHLIIVYHDNYGQIMKN
jgi:hypothetical protein